METPRFPIRPLGPRIVVLPDKPPEKTGSLWIPETAQRSSQTKTGVVVEVGPGTETPKGKIPVQLEVGDHVFFGEYAGIPLTIGTKQYTIMEEKEVIGVLHYEAAPASPEQDPEEDDGKVLDITKSMLPFKFHQQPFVGAQCLVASSSAFTIPAEI